jgi:hypothetical protein
MVGTGGGVGLDVPVPVVFCDGSEDVSDVVLLEDLELRGRSFA